MWQKFHFFSPLFRSLSCQCSECADPSHWMGLWSTTNQQKQEHLSVALFFFLQHSTLSNNLIKTNKSHTLTDSLSSIWWSVLKNKWLAICLHGEQSTINLVILVCPLSRTVFYRSNSAKYQCEIKRFIDDRRLHTDICVNDDAPVPVRHIEQVARTISQLRKT